MRRIQLIELEDHPWCPKAVRDGGTDWLQFLANATRVFDTIAPKIRAAMNATGTTHIVDLCSGGGGPWLTLERELAKSGPIDVALTDLYPNMTALESMRERSGGRCQFRSEGVDATNVPLELDGVRTMFNCFHHFAPENARAILSDAVRKRRSIAVFEGVDQRLLPILAMPLQAVGLALFTPFIKPFKLSRFALTYAVPLIPFIIMFDGTASMLRIYSPDELRELVFSVPGHETFDWDIGTTKVPISPFALTHLVGTPRPLRSA
ncbi:MAG: class I SAM-dependent methyltransferase [Labilithrix sp.]|nr:class I SAM-dependent methyltransferase [Labilithrix sp.]MBX3211226.1 class I SAM-dependent methyltransferase [Labilithrix sp.]